MYEHLARVALARRMRRPIHDDVWASLVDGGYVGDWLADAGTERESVPLLDMAKRVKELEDSGAPMPPRPSRLAADEQDRRLLIISDLCAADARKRRDVQQFRAEVLGSGLMSVQATPAWIRARAPKKVVPNESLTVELPPGHRLVKKRHGDTVTFRIDPAWLLDEVMVADRRGDQWVAGRNTACKSSGRCPCCGGRTSARTGCRPVS